MKIKFDKDYYTVEIEIEHFTLGSGDLEYAMKEILSSHWNWFNFHVGDRLWYQDGSDFITCESVDHLKGVIVFK